MTDAAGKVHNRISSPLVRLRTPRASTWLSPTSPTGDSFPAR
ncbi:hypothetical protein MMMB2_3055 [Mycobacterium marinum MB2]|nr:hypothetical protein MMMB2_3055 [Mycobacterium marinum MB2]